MKADIHPKYVETSIVCACGATYPDTLDGTQISASPSVPSAIRFHWSAEARGYGRAGGKIPEEVCAEQREQLSTPAGRTCRMFEKLESVAQTL